MEEVSSFFAKVQEVCRHLFSSQELVATLGRPEYTIAAFVVLNLVVFTETGLLFGCFLPGDSLLVTAGLVCYNTQQAGPGWNLPLLLGTLCAAAIIGDSVGYWIGFKTGPKIFTREKSLLFARDHLLKAQAFYERHGGKTIILARFMPLIRTFAPVVAGVGRMEYRRFLFYNVFGGVGWVCSMVLLGYFLTRAIDPPLQALLGEPAFTVRDHVEKVIIVVVLISISPPFIAWLRSKLARSANLEPVAAEVK
jgi:membrane-associated protein